MSAGVAVPSRITTSWRKVIDVLRRELVVRRLGLPLGERLLAERIRGEQPVAACVPVRGVAPVLRVVEDGERHRRAVHVAVQHRPLAARAPHRVSFLPLGRDVVAVHAGGVHLRHVGHLAARVGELLRLQRRLLELPRDAHADHAFLVVVERDVAVERGERGDALDRARAERRVEDVLRVLAQDRLLVGPHPLLGRLEHALTRAALRRAHGAMHDRPVLRRLRRRDRVGVVPEVEVVHVAVVEPEAGVVRMIDALTGARLERIAARDDDAVRRAQRIEHRLLERRRPDVRGERLAADDDVHAAVGLVRHDLRRSSDRRSSVA